MTALRQLSLGVRFLLELAVLAALGWVVLRLVDGPLRILAALTAVVVTATIWGLLVAPRAPIVLPLPGRLAVEVVVFGAAAAALVAADRLPLAVGFAVVAVVNRALLLSWGQ